MAGFDAKHRAKSMTMDVRSHFIGQIPDYLGRPDLLGKAPQTPASAGISGKTGLAVDLRLQMLLMHEAEWFRERSAAQSISYNPRQRRRWG